MSTSFAAIPASQAYQPYSQYPAQYAAPVVSAAAAPIEPGQLAVQATTAGTDAYGQYSTTQATTYGQPYSQQYAVQPQYGTAYGAAAYGAAGYGAGGVTYGGAAYGSAGGSYVAAPQSYASPTVGATAAPTAPGQEFGAALAATPAPFLPSAPSMVATTGISAQAPTPTNLQSSPSMIAYPGMGGASAFGGLGYPSAMDGPFKFYATPPPGNSPMQGDPAYGSGNYSSGGYGNGQPGEVSPAMAGGGGGAGGPPAAAAASGAASPEARPAAAGTGGSTGRKPSDKKKLSASKKKKGACGCC